MAGINLPEGRVGLVVQRPQSAVQRFDRVAGGRRVELLEGVPHP